MELRILSLVLFVTILLGCSNTTVKESVHSYIHISGKFEFPEELAGLKRSEIEKFDKGGNDLGVTYKASNDLSLVVTIYAYPTPKDENHKKYSLLEHFEGVDQAILERTPNTKQIKWPTGLPMWSDEGVPGVLQSYDLGGSGKIISLLQIYDYGDWALKFRSTYKADDGEKAIEAIKVMHSQFKWPK